MATVFASSSDAYLKNTVEPKVDTIQSNGGNVVNYTKLNIVSGNYNYPNGTTEEQVIEVPSSSKIHEFSNPTIDLRNLTQTGTLRVYIKMNGSYGQPVLEESTVAGEQYSLVIAPKITAQDIKITYQSDVNEGSAKDIYYEVGYRGE